MTQRRPDLSLAYALLAYTALAVLFAWPLPLHMSTHLTGSPDGDTGVYVWNQWVFREELLHHRQLPYFTDRIFSLSGTRANLSLHNYTTFQNLLALPLLGVLGVVATFNLIYLAMTVVTAVATYLLAREVTRSPLESWLAGALFAWSPVLVTRGSAHFSLVAAAPLAVFMLILLRATRRQSTSDALAFGAAVWWAASTDVYYAVYCLMIAAVYLAANTFDVQRREPVQGRRVLWALDALLFGSAGLVLAIATTGGWQFSVMGQRVGMRGIYTPVLVLTVLAVARVAWPYRFVFARMAEGSVVRLVRVACAGALVTSFLLSPVLYALGEWAARAGFDRGRIFWRSSPAGVDFLALMLPNPNHPLAPPFLREWLEKNPDGYVEGVASISFVALAIIVIALRLGWWPPRIWTVLTLAFGLLALGPFVHVAGVNSAIPGPWALLRFAPIVGLARTPARFAVVMMLGLAMLFATALAAVSRRWPHRRAAILTTTAGLLLFELLPAPRTLYSATIPRFYAQVAAEPGGVRVLELPFGIRDGTRGVGNFTSRSQFFQTAHGKALVGGYLSRVSKWRVAVTQRDEMLAALMTLSEGRRLSGELEQRLVEAGPRFVTRGSVAFVVVDRIRASDALIDFAKRAFRLRRVDGEGSFELYRPARDPDWPQQ